MAYDSTAQLHNSILVAMQCAAALMLTLIAATALKACGVLEDLRGFNVACQDRELADDISSKSPALGSALSPADTLPSD